jgi:HK97 family phage prohead protease
MKNREKFSGRQIVSAHRCNLRVKAKSFAAGDGTNGIVTLTGYPIVFANNAVPGTTSDDRGGYVVQIPNNATINWTSPVMALWHHQFDTPLGTTANKSLRIGQPDETGIPIELDLNLGTQIGNDVSAWVARGDVAGMSFSMANGFEDYDITDGDDTDNGLDVVSVNRFTVDEVTITPIPAMTATDIEHKEPPTPALPPVPTYTKLLDAQLKLKRLALDTFALR